MLSIEPRCRASTIDPGLRAYVRSFAAPLVALATLGAALLLAAGLA
jgi:hypothetical protein